VPDMPVVGDSTIETCSLLQPIAAFGQGFPAVSPRAMQSITNSFEVTWRSVNEPGCAVSLESLYYKCADFEISLKRLRRFEGRTRSDHFVQIGFRYFFEIFLGVHCAHFNNGLTGRSRINL